MTFRLKVTSQHRRCHSRFAVSQHLRDSLLLPSGSLNWMVKNLPAGALIVVSILEQQLRLQAFKIPYGSVVVPMGRDTPLNEHYRREVDETLLARIQKHQNDWFKDRSFWVFYIQGIGPSALGPERNTIRELKYLELPDPPIPEDMLLEYTTGVDQFQDADLQRHLV